MTREVGSRVGIVLGTQGKLVRVLGFGVYEGEQPCPVLRDFMLEGIEEMRADGALDDEAYAEYKKAAEAKTNPRLRTDDGRVFWGCQTWWGSEAEVKARIEAWKQQGYEIRMVQGLDE